MLPENQNIEMRRMVMRRVRTVYLARQIIKPFVIELSLFTLSTIALLSMVSVPSVIQNSLHSPDISRFLSYIAYAFLNTQTVVQIFGVAFLALGLLVAGNLILRLRGSAFKLSFSSQ